MNTPYYHHYVRPLLVISHYAATSFLSPFGLRHYFRRRYVIEGYQKLSFFTFFANLSPPLFPLTRFLPPLFRQLSGYSELRQY